MYICCTVDWLWMERRRKKTKGEKEKPMVRSVVPTRFPMGRKQIQISLGDLPLYYRDTLTKLFAANKFELLFAFLIIALCVVVYFVSY